MTLKNHLASRHYLFGGASLVTVFHLFYQIMHTHT